MWGLGSWAGGAGNAGNARADAPALRPFPRSSCGMNQSSLYEMKLSIVKVLSNFVEVDGDDAVEVNVSTDDGGLGTIYSVAVPVRRLKPAAVGVAEGDVDAADRFPYGV